MTPEKKKPMRIKKCSKGHVNGPTAKICWVCSEELDKPKPTFTQITNTTVIMEPKVPFRGIDVNIVVPGECENYVGKRERCDEKDPTGLPCSWRHNCAYRLKRFSVKPALDA